MDFNGKLMASTALAAAGVVYGAGGARAATATYCAGTFNVATSFCKVGSAGGRYTLTAIGGSGGNFTNSQGTAYGGPGSKVKATFDLQPGLDLGVYVGPQGADKFDPYNAIYREAIPGAASFVKLSGDFTSGAKYIEAKGGSAGFYRNGTLYDGSVVRGVNDIASGKNAYVAGSGVITYGANFNGAGSVTIDRIGDLPSSTPAVPIPPAGALLAGGLVSMAAMRKRKAKAAKA